MHRSIEKDMIPVLKLKEEFEIVHQICISSLETLNDDILSDCLEPLPFKHPVASSSVLPLGVQLLKIRTFCFVMNRQARLIIKLQKKS